MNGFKPSYNTSATANLVVALLVLLGLLAGLYYVLRYGGWTMEVDASRQAVAADGILTTGRLVNARAYNNGFGYAAQLSFVSLVTGIDLNSIQLSAGTWVFVVALVGFVTYREILGSLFRGALAAFLLLVQPDFMFYMVRGSHERTTWTCALLMLFFLVRSYRFAHSPRRLVAHVLLFYLAFWGMTAGNIFFASTFIVAIGLSLGIGWSFERLFLRDKEAEQSGSARWRRLMLISTTCLIVVYVFVNYLYQPARQFYYVLMNLVDKLSVLVFGAEPVPQVVAYQYFGSAWRDPLAYLAVTGMQWVIAASSLGVWLWLTFHLAKLEAKTRFLWQLYTSFGILLAFSLVADFSGFLSSNLQLRLFTPFAMFSSAIVAFGIQESWPRLQRKFKRVLVPAVGLLAVFAFMAGQVKITNDPAIANQWVFYSPAEMRAGQWLDATLKNQRVWVDISDHLRETFYFQEGYVENRPNQYENKPDPAGYPYILISQLTQLKASRMGISLPSTVGYLQIYDNGGTQLFHRRPQTPYQH
ncbi:MAG TPA: hypothetical protein VMS73_06690 [Anaerolineaceae bacterium]|nr:hypothetical protein [Anaerolineaceae bacterium]